MYEVYRRAKKVDLVDLLPFHVSHWQRLELVHVKHLIKFGPCYQQCSAQIYKYTSDLLTALSRAGNYYLSLHSLFLLCDLCILHVELKTNTAFTLSTSRLLHGNKSKINKSTSTCRNNRRVVDLWSSTSRLTRSTFV